MMDPHVEKKRKRDSDSDGDSNEKDEKGEKELSFLQQRRFILTTLGYYMHHEAQSQDQDQDQGQGQGQSEAKAGAGAGAVCVAGKVALRESLEHRFREIVRVSPHGHAVPSMNVLEFTNDCLARGHTANFAAAGFRILVDNGDILWDNEVCRLMSITLDEYVAFRLCLPPHYPPAVPAMNEGEELLISEDMAKVKEIIQQWHHRLIFYMYDGDGSGSLQVPDLKNLVSDLMQVTTHVDDLVLQLCPSSSSSSHVRFTVEDLSNEKSLEVLDDNNCSLSNLLDPKLTTYYSRSSVLDTRALTSQIPSALAMPPPRNRLSSVQHGMHSLNTTEVHLPDSMRPLSDWRGLLVNRHCPAFEIANVVVANAHRMMLRTYSENDIQDSDWMTPGNYPTSSDASSSSSTNSDDLAGSQRSLNGYDKLRCLHELLAGPNDDVTAEVIEVRPILSKMAALCTEARRIMAAQPIVLKVPQPCKVFGDIHGQLRDLLLLFREYGFPNNQGGDVDAVKYVFDGDFVDRGAHQLEVVVLLFALKVAYPGCVFLLRGNHEMRDQNMAMGKSGFFAACRDMFKLEYADKLFLFIHSVFDWLPLAAVVAKRVLVLHGGIGDGAWALEELDLLQRPIGHDFMNGTESGTRVHNLLIQVLWSDPSEGHDDENPGVHCNERGKGIMTFSNDITQSFCRRNNLSHIIRGHQYVAKGYKILHGGRVVTVFSARNYFDRVQNDSAIILISEDEEGNVRLKPKTLLRRLTERVPL